MNMKSVVFQSPDERNYHLFYELLGGLSETEKSELGLTSPRDFAYLVHVRQLCSSQNKVLLSFLVK